MVEGSTDTAPIPTLAAGRSVLMDRLGEGGMAAVYRAQDTQLGVARAVKLVLPIQGRASIRRRLRAEARAMARIDHPNILAIHDVGVEDDQDYVVMTLAQGGSLGDRLAEGPLRAAVAAHLMAQVLDALAAAHGVGIIHRDVKPQNILLDDGGRPLLADFGIALLAHDDRRTRTGVAMGSIAYMPPEQRLDAARVGPEADVYSCGATLYALVTGSNPVDLFMAEDDSHRYDDVPDALQPVIRKACAPRPADRYATAGEMAQALLHLLEHGDLDGIEAVKKKEFAAPDAVFSQRSTRGMSVGMPSLPTVGSFGDADRDGVSAETFLPDEPSEKGAVAVLAPPAGPPRHLLVRGLVAAGVIGLLGAGGGLWLTYSLWPESVPVAGVWSPSPRVEAVAEPVGAVEAAVPEAPPVAEPEPEPEVPVEAPAPAPVEAAPAPAPAAAPAPKPVPAPAEPPVAGLTPPAGVWEGSMGGVLVTLTLGDDFGGSLVTQFGANRSEVAVVGSYEEGSRMLRLEERGDGALATYQLTLDADLSRATGQVITATHKRPVTLTRRSP